MSHAHGEVWSEGKVIAYFEYDGTSDIAMSALYDTHEGMLEMWRSFTWNECTCGQPSLPVILYTNYGGGYHWPATVCLTCRAITSNLKPYDGEVFARDGFPSEQCFSDPEERLHRHPDGEMGWDEARSRYVAAPECGRETPIGQDGE